MYQHALVLFHFNFSAEREPWTLRVLGKCATAEPQPLTDPRVKILPAAWHFDSRREKTLSHGAKVFQSPEQLCLTVQGTKSLFTLVFLIGDGGA